MWSDRGRLAAGEMRGERLRLRVCRVEHVERVEVFNAETQRRRDAEYAEAVRGGFALRTDFIVTHKQGFISGGQPPDPQYTWPCRRQPQTSLRLCVSALKTFRVLRVFRG